ncbi:hypothetical protein KAFR_0E00940 [Kazachstania africana CBS 2517]|uniref:Uncharacterized protein n=1 Tax=Kazachstania africana (strain ATCC 22294 / BCRC 22015 / CBS 2517 / CECT 1963 / NBRC 1671 / NRRL Y-8276) TaxID=1071382 RepID=H2AV48_KAZAF|nr:hypothetical protein KAFR_0E00940 [Kazachstania africana CBS 2517]CCF58248.1 hypothetical protein KAFR_0E00940 [Kazachstania africana CBS 2517]
MGLFKHKRQHAPDPIGIGNYKRRKLIEDFANLSLDANSPTTPSSNDVAVTKIVPSRVDLPKSVRDRLLMFQDSEEEESYLDNGILISKIAEWIKMEASQMVKWVDWRQMIYFTWLRWYQSTFLPKNHFDVEGDYDVDFLQYDRLSTTDNDKEYDDMDIDMQG